MDEVIKIFYEIQATKSINEKKAILAANKDNELLKECLVFLLDSNIKTGISAKKITKQVVAAEYLLPTFNDVMKYLRSYNTGTDTDIAMVQGFISEQPEEHREFYTQMITKKFKLGCDKKVVNAVINGLISSWDVQQAYPISEKNRPNDGDTFGLSQKLNGTNASFYKGKLISRQGKEYAGLDHIIADIEKIPNAEKYYFNGELMRKNIDNLSDNDNFQLGTGIINADDVDKSCIEFVIYECFPVEEFEAGESKLNYFDRRKTYLMPLHIQIDSMKLTNIRIVSLCYYGDDLAMIDQKLAMANQLGWEGLMLNKDTKWQNKRNNGILKVKSFKHADIRCTGVVEGQGKYAGTLGAITCDYKGYRLDVGSGFTDKQRGYYWNNPDKIVGKIVQLKYKNETKNKDGGLSVQFPIFEIVRTDKTEPSYEV